MKKTISCRRRQGFTLIELLVVIGIIALLAGLLMPTIGGSLERARETMCASNEKQLALACINYAGDHDGKLPNNKEWTIYGANGGFNWYVLDGLTNGTLFPYVKDVKVYLCPTFFRIVRQPHPDAKRSYSMNFRVDDKYQSDGVTQMGDGGIRNILSVGSVRRPGGCVLMSEEDPPYAPFWPSTVNGVIMASRELDDGRLCWGNGHDDWTVPSARNSPATFHRNNSAKAAFFDGHSETFIMDDKFQWKYKWEPMAP